MATNAPEPSVVVSGTPPVPLPSESPVTTVQRWRDWRFSPDRE